MTAERACGCPVCQRRRRLESKLDVARDVLAGRKLFVTDADGRAVWQWQPRAVAEMIGELEEAIDRLGALRHGRLPGPKPRRPRRSIGQFMQRRTLHTNRTDRGMEWS